MPCQRCGTRQDDPARGPSLWKRAVSGGTQVLICPECQRDAKWQEGVDHCPSCDGVRLSKTLGVLRCSGCGWSSDEASEPNEAMPSPAPSSRDDELAAEVQAALRRVLDGPRGDAAEVPSQ